jgi:hypothetical protein
MALRAFPGWVGALLLAGAGCAGVPQELGPGEPCTRTAQCAAGLACVQGECSDDLDGLGGTVPALDAGIPPQGDAALAVDADPQPEDAGTPPPEDAGTPPPEDAGTPPPEDAGTPPPGDAGTPPGDAAPSEDAA